MKPIGGNHGDLGSHGTSGHRKGAPSKARDEFVIVPMDDDFDLDALFQSEGEPVVLAAAPDDPPALADPAALDNVEPEAPQSFLAGTPAAESAASHTTEPAASLPDEADAPLIKELDAPFVNGREAPEPPLVATAVVLPFDDVSPAVGTTWSVAHDPAPKERPKSPALSIADLIDNHVRLEWYEAVAIALHLCRVMSRESGANTHRSLVEPWNVEITKSGEVHVLPGGSSSDPLVKQVGRVLRVLLQDSIAPAELRLVASQASFEVPIYSSVDELSTALRHFERPGNSDAIRAAFNRGLEAKFSTLTTHEHAAPAVRPPPAPVTPVARALPRKAPPVHNVEERSPFRFYVIGTVAAVVVAATAVFVGFRLTDISDFWSFGSTSQQEQRVGFAQQPDAPPLPERRAASSAPRPPAPSHPAPGTISPRAAPPVARVPSRANDVPEGASVSAVSRIPEPVQRPAAAADSLQTTEQRAGALLAEGRTGEAAVLFDSIVMRNPLYQLDPVRSVPEALGLFQASKRLLLPAMARRYYQEARVAYDTGDFSMTLTKGQRALALLRDAEIEPSEAALTGDVSDLMALATAARTLEASRIYSVADRDVTPPRPMGRQLSAASLSGRAPLTGRLELVVGLTGEVENVKLETPVNGYHDRMIVSAAKAWHYRPALRKGQPVRYSMIMSITLPDF